jgi:chorismate mutase
MPKWISLGRADGYQAPDKATAGAPREDTAETMALPVTAAPPAADPRPAPSAAQPASAESPPSETTVPARSADDAVVDLKRRRAQLSARVAELQFDLGGLVYEMAIRDRIRVDVIVKRAAQLQDADAELSEIERILRLEESSTAGSCGNCGAPHSSGAAYCWQCGQPLLQQVPHSAIG